MNERVSVAGGVAGVDAGDVGGQSRRGAGVDRRRICRQDGSRVRGGDDGAGEIASDDDLDHVSHARSENQNRAGNRRRDGHRFSLVTCGVAHDGGRRLGIRQAGGCAEVTDRGDLETVSREAVGDCRGLPGDSRGVGDVDRDVVALIASTEVAAGGVLDVGAVVVELVDDGVVSSRSSPGSGSSSMIAWKRDLISSVRGISLPQSLVPSVGTVKNVTAPASTFWSERPRVTQ